MSDQTSSALLSTSSKRLGSDPRIEFGFLLADVTRLMRLSFDREMDQLGLTRSQWRALAHIFRLDGPTQSALAEALDIGRASVGALVQQLEKSGYVARVPDATDRRVWRVVPTDLAARRAEDLAKVAEVEADRTFAGLNNHQITAASDVIVTMLQNLRDSSA